MWQDIQYHCSSQMVLALAGILCYVLCLLGFASWPEFLEAAAIAHSPASCRTACRNPWPLVDPDHPGDGLIPHRVPGGPEKECR